MDFYVYLVINCDELSILTSLNKVSLSLNA